MIPSLNAEIRKLRCTRTWWALLLGGASLCLLTAYGYAVEGRSAGAAASPASITSDVARSWMMLFLFASVLAALAVSREYGAGTMTRTVLLGGTRGRVFTAKAAMCGLIGVVYGAGAALGAVISPFAIMPLLGLQPRWSADATLTVVGVAVCGVLAALWGGALGWLLRNPLGAVGTIIALTLLVDPGVQRLAPDAAKYLFTIALSSIYRDGKVDLLPLWPAVAVAAAWVVAAGVLAHRHLLRTDVR